MAQVRHMVLLKFKKGTTDDTIADAFAALAELQERIPGLQSFCGGPYSSPEGLNKGFTHGFIMTFESAAARDAYLPHPDHEKVKHQVIKHLDDIITFDFEA